MMCVRKDSDVCAVRIAKVDNLGESKIDKIETGDGVCGSKRWTGIYDNATRYLAANMQFIFLLSAPLQSSPIYLSYGLSALIKWTLF